jgi:hypothetical protein
MSDSNQERIAALEAYEHEQAKLRQPSAEPPAPDFRNSHMISEDAAVNILVRMYRRRLENNHEFLQKEWRKRIHPKARVEMYDEDWVVLVPRLDD